MIRFRATIRAQTRSQGINRKVQHVPIGDSEKDVLIRTQALVQSSHDLVLVAAAARSSREVVRHDSCGGGSRNPRGGRPAGVVTSQAWAVEGDGRGVSSCR